MSKQYTTWYMLTLLGILLGICYERKKKLYSLVTEADVHESHYMITGVEPATSQSLV